MERNYKDDGSSTRVNGLENTEMDFMIFRTTKKKQKYNNHEEVPTSQEDRC
jgi:hypothetical protein